MNESHDKMSNKNFLIMETKNKKKQENLSGIKKDSILKFMTLIIICLAIAIPQSYGQAVRTITGVVTDESNQPLPGVNVHVKQSNNGVITDMNGNYTIKVSEKDEILVFAYIGYETEEVKIKEQKTINVKMKISTADLEEVVVKGYGVLKHRDICGAVAAVETGSVSSFQARGNKRMNSPMMYDQQYHDYNTEGYSTIHENGFREVTREPLSTFSVDVDKASYSNIRRFLNNGQLPPVDAVRIEEMINYFSYNYPQPDGEDPFSVNKEMTVCPWNNEHYLLKVGLKGKEMDKTELPPSNLVFLIDVSGSMGSANKLPLLKSAFSLLVKELRPEDRVAIVVYAGAAGLVLESTSGNKKEKILASLNQLNAGGSTAGGAGLKLAYQVAEEYLVEGGNNRIILATDGDFNVGASSNAEMERMIESERDKGIFITVLGFGMGNYKDDKMEIIADKGNGNYAYIDNLQEAQKTLVSEFGGTLFTIAKDVKFQIEFNPQKIAAYRLIGYENRLLNNEDFNDDKKDAGEIGAGHTVTALYEIVPVSANDVEEYVGKVDPLKYQVKKDTDHKTSGEWLTLKLRYKKPDGNKSILIEKTLSGPVKEFEKASEDLRFAASVAGFGMLLRDSKQVGDLTIDDVKSMAIQSKGIDVEGYRGEMVRLIGLAKGLKKDIASKD